MMTNADIRVACVGAGYFSRFHTGSWARMDRVKLVGSCDRDIEKARATSLPAFNDPARMFAETRPDLVDIILPPAAHAETIRAALAAGINTVICQKPFCGSQLEAQTIVAEAEAAGVTLIVHENFRFQPWYRTIRQALDKRAVGDVHQMTFRLRPGDGQGPDAYLDRQPYFQTMDRFLVHETAVHWIDTFRYLFGNPLSVYADLRRINPVIAGEDAGYILFEHRHGIRTFFDGNRHIDHATDNLRRTMGEALVEGTEGTLRLDGDGSVRLRSFGAADQQVLLQPDRWDGFGGDCVHALQRHVISGLVVGTALENCARDYLDVIRIEQAIYKSAGEGRKIVLETA